MIDPTVPVLNIWRGGYGDVSIARTLGRLDIPMYLIAQSGLETPVWYSRYWSKKSRWDYGRPEEASVDHLLQAGRFLRAAHGARPILLTTSDWLAIFIERHGERLEHEFDFPRSRSGVVRALLNKWEMHQLAIEHDVPTPRTAFPTSTAELDEYLRVAEFPIVVKSADAFVAGSTVKAIVGSAADLRGLIEHAQERGPLNVVLQEYIPGDAESVWMCNGYFSDDPAHTVTFTGRKLRQKSATGIASLAVCLPNDAVTMQTRRLMEGVGYRGCVGIGWRHDHRDGRYKLLDVNARVSGIFRLFAGTNGMDVVRACYLDRTGQDLPHTELQPGRRWMLEDDLFEAALAIRDRRLTVAGWARSLRGVRELQWSAADDPLPAFEWLRLKGLSLWKRVVRSTREGSDRLETRERGGSAMRPTDGDIDRVIQQHWDRRASTFDETDIGPTSGAKEQAWRDLLSGLVERAPQRVLDVGCGTGFLALALASLGHRVTGIDLSPSMLAQARAHAEDAGRTIDFDLGNAAALDYPDGSFDAVVARHVIWNLPEPERAFEEWLRVLRDGGRLIVIEGKWADNEALARAYARPAPRLFTRALDVATGLVPPRTRLHQKLMSRRYHRLAAQLPFSGGLPPDRLAELFERNGVMDVAVESLMDPTLWGESPKFPRYLVTGTSPTAVADHSAGE